jgi:AcrR family transcriptional regulator
VELATSRAAASRQRLLAAAAAELVEQGGALEVHSVARRAGTSVGLIYRYFDSKAGLLAAVVDAFYDRLDEAVFDANPLPDGDWAARERLRTELGVAFHYDDPLAGVILSRLAREPEVAAVEARRIQRHVDAAARNLKRGQKRGEIPADLDAGLAGAMVIGGLRQVIGAALARRRPPPREAVTGELWRFIAAAVRYRPTTEED